MDIRELHKLAIAQGFPQPEVHELLHDMAVFAFRDTNHPVSSLTQCSPDQLEYLANSIRGMHYGRSEDSRRKSQRPRRARPAAPGVTKMITAKQLDFINILASELAWTKDILNRFVKKYFGVNEPRELATATAAGQCIQQLKAVKWYRDKDARPRP